MAFDYDLFVIGAGSGGVRASRMAATTGATVDGEPLRVAIAEQGPLGGTCVNVGCVPKKLMVYASHLPEEIEEANGFGWSVEGLSHDWPQFIQNKNVEIARLNDIYGNLLKNAGVELISGSARVTGAHEVTVNGVSYSAERILVAVGGKPVMPDSNAVPGIEHAICSDQLFYLDKMPQRLIIVGGGYIALEFAGIFAGLGAQVDVVYRGHQPLKHFDHDISAHLLEQMQNKGIHFHLGKEVSAIAKGNTDSQLLCAQLNDETKLVADHILYAVGRSGYIDDLGLNELGVSISSSGIIEVDDSFKTSVSSIYALGDVIGTPALTPVALAQAMVFVNQLYGDHSQIMTYEAIPTAVFTQPNIATVGITEQEALDAGFHIDVYKSDFKHLKHTLSASKERVLMKMVIDQSNQKVLGVHMIGPDAGEIIQGFSLAVKCGLTKQDLDSVIGIHPTAAEEFVTMRQVSYQKP